MTLSTPLPSPPSPELEPEHRDGRKAEGLEQRRSEARVGRELRGDGPDSGRAAIARRDRGWLVRRALLVADAIGLCLTFLITTLVFGSSFGVGVGYDALAEVVLLLVGLLLWIVAAKVYGLYDRDEERADATTADDLGGVLQLLTFGTWVVFAALSLVGLGHPGIGEFVFFWLLATVLVTVSRAGGRAFSRRQPAYRQNALIIGAGDVGQLLGSKLLHHPEYGIDVLGFIDDEPRKLQPEVGQVPVVGSSNDLPTLIRSLDIDRVLIAFSGETHQETLQLMRTLGDFDLRIDVVPRLFENIPPDVNVHMLQGITLLGLPRPRLSRSSCALKRAMDILLATVLLILFVPLFAVVAVLIKLDSHGPVLFRQIRIGFREKPFAILKFRTMTCDAEEQKPMVAHLNKHSLPGGDPRMFKIHEDPRQTRVGRILRRYSLDELPQLINVLRGQMSLVGPRPLIPEEHGFLAGWGLRRLDLKPGMTGLWQVLGRDVIGFAEMVRLDYFYVTTWSPWNDIRLLLRTFSVVAKGERPPPSFPPAANES